jgi:general secretion pathway protein A
MQAPFKVSPNPNLMYVTSALQGSLEKIRFMISERQGLGLILGDNGTGKSTVLRYLVAEYSAEGYSVGLLNQTEFPSPYALLKAICAQFGLDPKRSQAAQHSALEDYLIEEYRAGRTAILFVDEGQRLTAELLEVVRALLNLETYEDKLLQIVMAGTLEMRDRILAKRSKALRSRVFAPCMLVDLSPQDTAAMIAFRCDRAGIETPFDLEGCRRIYERSRGNPRDTLLICAHAWRLARKEGLRRVPIEVIDAACDTTSIPAEPEGVTA